MNCKARTGLLIVALATAFAAANFACAATPEECQTLRKHGHNDQARTCFESLTQSREAGIRAEGFWGLEQYEDANNEFRTAVEQAPNNANYRVRWGRLLHERFNNKDASDLFNEALQRDPKNAQAYLGLALVSADGFDNKAVEEAKKALELDPKLVEAHELMARLALEDYDSKAAAAEADEALKISPEALDAMAIHATIDVLADHSPDEWFAKIAQINPHYGEAYAIVAHHLTLNMRFQDSIGYYRKAIEVDPRLWPARSELGIQLMRFGQTEEPFQLLEECYNNGYRDAATVNTLRLLDSFKNFETFKDDETIIKLNKKEAELLLPYVRAEARRAIATYEKKYKMKLPGPVQIELYPNHEDFAVRTLGMPGLGALGVTFGEVIALDSPSGRPPGSYHWGETLWHEMSHVFILNATNNRVPRWFTEGLAVHEESQVAQGWGDRVSPEILVAIREKKLLPIAELDRGFIRPDYPAQVIVSYFQGGKVLDFIDQRWGDDKILDMVHSYAQLKKTPEVIQQDLGISPEEFDSQFTAWLNKDVGKEAASFDEWRTRLKDLAEAAKAKNWDEVLAKGDAVRQLYPDYVEGANAYEFMAEAYVAKGDKKAAASILAEYAKIGGRSPDALKQLASMQQELGDSKNAAATLESINYVYPMDEDLHRKLCGLLYDLGNPATDVRECSAVLAMHPLDQASAQFDVARAYFAAGQQDQARDHLLASLEAAPDYRPAQKLLLELEDSQKGK
ncbi:MAG TPA: tetratricopeptide repeat protein [Candidatus Acidoferrales bacterium]|nr:tetratricopeptide repeat protein [Candidatus Acidoferrales bacterium]